MRQESGRAQNLAYLSYPVPALRRGIAKEQVLSKTGKWWFIGMFISTDGNSFPSWEVAGVCEFSLIDRKITHPLSPLERGNRYSRRYEPLLWGNASCHRLSFAVDFNQRIDKFPALPDSSVGLNPFQIPIGGFIKGAKAHRGTGFASNLLNRSLKRTAQESLRHEALPHKRGS